MRFSGLLALILMFGSPAYAAEATIKSVRGTVTVKKAGSKAWVKARPGRALNRNDQVRTGTSGVVQLNFTSGATMLVKEKSRFSLKRDSRGRIVAFQFGEFLIGLRPRANRDDRFRVRTPAAVAAVRGTVFWGKSDENKTSTYACFTGAIDIWAKGENVTLEPGLTSTIPLDQAPSAPEPHTISANYAAENFAIDGSLGGIEDILSEEQEPAAQ